MNIYCSEDIKKAVPLIRYFTDKGVPLSSGNRRAVATWRGGTHPSVSIDLDKQVWNDHVTGKGVSVVVKMMLPLPREEWFKPRKKGCGSKQ